MVEKWFVITLLVIHTLGIGVDLGKHGKPKTGEYNAWLSLIAVAIFYTMAYFGGLFRCFE